MPRYVFKCSNSFCKQVEEYVYRMADCPSALRCPHCLEGTMKKQIGVGVRLITQPHWQRPDNDIRQHMYHARDDRELVAAIKADEKAKAVERETNEARRKANPIVADDPYPDVLGFEEYAAMGYELPTVAEARKLATKGGE